MRNSYPRVYPSTHNEVLYESPSYDGTTSDPGVKTSFIDATILHDSESVPLGLNTGSTPLAPKASRATGDRTQPKPGVTSLENLIEGYRLYARSEGKSQNTIALTATAVGILVGLLQQEGLSTDVTRITAQDIRSFILSLQQTKVFSEHPFARPQERRLSGHTVNCYLRTIRAFWSWLVYEEIIDINPFSRIKIPSPPRKVIPTFTEDQIQALFGAIDTSTPTGFRDWTIGLTLLDTGVRVSEIANLTLENVNLDHMQLKVYGKGAKERTVPIGVRVQRAIWKYTQQYRPDPANPRFTTLFLTKDGKPVTKGRIETQIKRLGERARITGVRCSPHTFRHTFATSYLRNGGNVFNLQSILGHSSLETTMCYINLAQTDVQDAHRRYSPADTIDLTKKTGHGVSEKQRCRQHSRSGR